MPIQLIEKRRAIEALRAGVPNRDVVKQLPPLQEDIKESFIQLLNTIEGTGDNKSNSNGLLLEGGFGTGKSHWLEYFRHVALDANFVVSSIVLNKETPPHHLQKVYRACVESAVVRDKTGPALAEIARTYHSDRAPFFRELFDWVRDTPGLDPRFIATLQLVIAPIDLEILQQIINDWTGYPMKVPDIRKALRSVGETGIRVGKPMKGQELQRFAFLSKFFKSAGYSGWLILLDEGEFTSHYSLRQRARAYANLALLFGCQSNLPELATVLTISDDYIGQVLYGKKNDRENIPLKVGRTCDSGIVPLAEQGMELILRKGRQIRPYTSKQVDDVYNRVRQLYSDAYNWDAPDLEKRPEVLPSERMRRYIRSWINAWDFLRLYGTSVNLVSEDFNMDLDEDSDIQKDDEDLASDSYSDVN